MPQHSRLGSALHKFLKSRGIELPKKKTNIVRSWYHAQHGEQHLTIAELVRKFPEQELQNQCLSKVASGERHSHKGWIRGY